MNKRETVQAFVDSIQQGEFENAKSMLADDFQFNGAVSEPINTEAWLGMSATLKRYPEDGLPGPGLSFQGHRRRG
jgi:hypothetical protein